MKSVFTGLLVVALSLPSPWVQAADGPGEFFKSLTGPTGTTVVPGEITSDWHVYHHPDTSQLAVLLTDPDSCWLGLVHGLKTIGVPFYITTDYREALKSAVVLVYPTISGRVMQADGFEALTAYATTGGTLLAVNVLGGGMQQTFGFKEAIPSHDRWEIRWDTGSVRAFGLDDPKELTLQMGSPTDPSRRPGTYGYSGNASPLAVYDDGLAVLTSSRIGKGNAYAFGIDVGAIILQGYDDRDEWAERSYVNNFEPFVDVFLRVLKGLYVKHNPEAVTLGTVPDGKSLAVVLTHDIDYARSVDNSLAYAAYEKSQGIRATYFIQTKYIRDYNDEAFFTTDEVPSIRQLVASGMEMASHTVCHSRQFSQFPLGTGLEVFPTYHPFVRNRTLTENGSILGELRISKFMVELFSGDHSVESFRPGHLSNPQALPQSLWATGYRFSSSATANNCLTHFPFQLNYNRDYRAELPIFEFPVTIEDEAAPELLQRLPQALTLAHQLSRYGASMVILIHPNIVGQKFSFEQGFVSAMKSSAWFGALEDYGHWWTARNQVDARVVTSGRDEKVFLTVPQPMDSLLLQVPKTWTLAKESIGSNDVTSDGVLLRHPSGTITLLFRRR